MIPRAAALVVLVGLGTLCGWPPAGPARGDVLAARKGVRLVSVSGSRPSGHWQAWATASRMPTIRGEVTLRLQRCPKAPTAAGCVITKHPRVIYVQRGLRNPRGVMLHELGHVYDMLVMSDRDRDRFRRIMRQPVSRQWWIGRTPLAEWFAEAYSWCARYAHIVSIKRYALYRYRPTPTQHTRACTLIRSAARDRTPPQPPPVPPVVTGDPSPPPPPSMAPGTVPGDPERDPGPAAPEPAQATPTPNPLPDLSPILTPAATPSPTATASDAEDPPVPEASGTPEPTPPPTSEPEPTVTPDPTETPEPADTLEPTPTAEPEPTPTPRAGR